MMNDDVIICDTCIAKSIKSHGCHGKHEECVACSMYYKDPHTLIGYLKYYLKTFKNRIRGKWYYFKLDVKMFIIDHFGKKTPSCIARGDIVEWVFANEVKETATFEELRKIAHRTRVNRVWVDYAEWQNKFVLMADLTTDDGKLGSCNGVSELNASLMLGNSNDMSGEDKIIITINGKRKLELNKYSGKWESVFGMKSNVVQCDDYQSGNPKEDSTQE